VKRGEEEGERGEGKRGGKKEGGEGSGAKGKCVQNRIEIRNGWRDKGEKKGKGGGNRKRVQRGFSLKLVDS